MRMADATTEDTEVMSSVTLYGNLGVLEIGSLHTLMSIFPDWSTIFFLVIVL